MIEIRNLSKHFGPIRAVDNVSFSVAQGEVLGFLGPNGAGKSTTMKMVTGFLTPSEGTALVCGHDVQKEPIEAKRKLGYLPEGAPLYPDMTPRRFLHWAASVRGMPKAEGARRVAEVVERVQLGNVLDQRMETLSKGFKRRVGLAQAILHDPPVLVLDEPTDGLDPNQKHEVRSLIREMSREKAIVLSTHILEEVDAVCSRVILIARGKLLVDEAPREMLARSRYHNAVTVHVRGDSGEELERAVAEVATVERSDGGDSQEGLAQYTLFPRNGQPILPQVSERLAGLEVVDIHVEGGRLDEVFRNLTTADSESRS